MRRAWGPAHAEAILWAVECWAFGAMMFRELEAFADDPEHGCVAVGRLDALLVPMSSEAPWARKVPGWCWSARRLVGVEVKCSRSDFLAGIRKDQFSRYQEAVSGLYLATPPGVINRGELPEGIGHLVVHSTKGPAHAVCKRHPTFADTKPPVEMLWKILFLMRKQQIEEKKEREQERKDLYQRLGERVGLALRAIEDAGDGT